MMKTIAKGCTIIFLFLSIVIAVFTFAKVISSEYTKTHLTKVYTTEVYQGGVLVDTLYQFEYDCPSSYSWEGTYYKVVSCVDYKK